MDATVLAVLGTFTIHVASTVFLAEVWRGKRPPRPLKVRPGDSAKLTACLNRATTRSRRKRIAWIAPERPMSPSPN